jgi:capsular exopolysaccharide synthesis family protein
MELKLEEISLEARVSSLREVINDYEVKILPDTTSRYQENFRHRELVYLTINQLNSRLIEAQSAAHGSLSRFILSDEPTVPVTPANRPLIFFILLGVVAGIAVSAGLILLYDMLDNRLMVVNDYERFFKYPLLGGFMHNNKIKQQVEELLDPDVTSEMLFECSEISVNVKHLIKSDNKVFTLCSPVRGEGKSLISFLIAICLAKSGMNVLLADFDFYDPRLTKKLGCDLNQGLTDYITGDLPLEYIYNDTPLPNLSFAPAGRTSTPSKFSYDSEYFRNFISLSRQMFDVVIVDTPAVLYIPDVVTFMDSIDSVLVVARLRKTSRNSLIRMVNMFGDNKHKIAGAILNDIQKGISSRYSCYYNYKYEYQYSHNPKKFI